ncbi:MAG TPA: hypothetical protein VIO11_00235 [Candidatus Methanoperedens sp.]
MVIRKNISLEDAYLKKLEALTSKNGGNLSAAIRDSINVSEAALHRYATVENALTSLAAERKELSPRERSIENGKNVLLGEPIFLWMLKWTKGIPLDKEILDELLDPLKIKTVSDLDKQINNISRESGWNCEISIFCMDDINPETATVTVSGHNEFHRDFLAQLVVMFLVYDKYMDIDVVHKRATAIRIDLKKRDNGAYPLAAMKHFGYLKNALDEFISRKDFWVNLINIYLSANYNMVSLHKEHYEKSLACNTPSDTIIFESLSKRHISNIPHPDFLKMLKKTHESLLIIDKIELFDKSLNVYHNYKDDNAIQKLIDYYLSLLRENGHEYEAKYSSSLIVLNHKCCKD